MRPVNDGTGVSAATPPLELEGGVSPAAGQLLLLEVAVNERG